MKFFAAVKLATFATNLFAKAGLNLEAFHAAADENALKAHIEQAVAAAPAKPGADHEPLLAEAVAENLKLTADLAQANKTLKEVTEGRACIAAVHEDLVGALTACGVKIDAVSFKKDKPEENAKAVKAALDSRISTKARELVAATGGPLLDESPENDSTKATSKGAKATMTLEDWRALNPVARHAFFKNGGKLTA